MYLHKPNHSSIGDDIHSKKSLPLKQNVDYIPINSLNQMQKTFGNYGIQQLFKESTIIQRQMIFGKGTEHLDASTNIIPYSAFNSVQNKAKKYYEDRKDLEFEAVNNMNSAASFSPDDFWGNDKIQVKSISAREIAQERYDYNDLLIEVTHETQHAIDHNEDLDLSRGGYKDKVISEFRTFAAQSALSMQIENQNKLKSTKYKDMQQSFSSSAGFTVHGLMFNIIKKYLEYYSGQPFDDTLTEEFIKDNQNELNRARNIYKDLLNNNIGEHDRYKTTEVEKIEEDEFVSENIKISTVKEVKKDVWKKV